MQNAPEQERSPVRTPGTPGAAGGGTGRGAWGARRGGERWAEPRDKTGGTPSDGGGASEQSLHMAVGFSSWAGAMSIRQVDSCILI